MNVKFIKIVAFSLFLFMGFGMNAQTNCFSKENNVWYFGEHAGIDFNGTTPVAITGNTYVRDDGTYTVWTDWPASLSPSYEYHSEGVASICSPSGLLLFYTNGEKLWRRDGSEYPALTLKGSTSSSQSTIIVKKPNSCEVFYIFTIDDNIFSQGTNQGVHYTEYSFTDLEDVNDLGTINAVNVQMLPFNSLKENLTATKADNGNVYVIAHEDNTDKFYIMEVTSSGVNMDYGGAGIPYKTYNSGHGVHSRDKNYLRFNSEGNRLAVSTRPFNYNEIVEFYHFDNGTLTYENSFEVDLWTNAHEIYGLEFSPNGNYLYVSERNGGRLHQLDISDINNINEIWFDYDETSIGLFTGNAGALQMAPNGELYCTVKHEDFLLVNNNPDNVMTQNSWAKFPLANNTLSSEGLPNFINVISFNIEMSSTAPCYNMGNGTASAYVDFDCGTFNYQWSGPSGPISTNAPTITGLSPGTYYVTVSNEYDCSRTGSIEVIAIPELVANTTSLDIVCAGTNTGSIDLTVSGGIPSYTYNWSNGANTEDIGYLNQDGTYTVTVTDDMNCTTIAQANISIGDPLGVDVSIEEPCPNGDNGEIHLTCVGAPGMCFYNWSSPITTNYSYAVNLEASNYTVTVQAQYLTYPGVYPTTQIPGGAECTHVENITLNEGLFNMNITADVVDVTCSGYTDGEINDITVISGDGTSPFLYSHNGVNWETYNSFVGWNVGNHPIYVMDADGCVDSESFFVDVTNDMCDCYEILSPTPIYPGPFEIYGNHTINQDYIVEDGITILAGGHLFIDDCKLEFKPGTGINVSVDAYLNVTSSTLTSINDCDNFWKGISATSAQPNFLGTPNVYFNNSILSNASHGIAISMSRLDINNSTFENNVIDIIKGYPNAGGTAYIDYGSNVKFISCVFTTNSTLSDYFNTYPTSHIFAENCESLIFNNCTFKSEFPIIQGGMFPGDPLILFPIGYRGKGIWAQNASFAVTGSTFEKLEYGIKVEQATNVVEINDDNVFNYNYNGVLLENADDAEITNNTFKVWTDMLGITYPAGTTPQNAPANYPYGLYINSSPNFVFEENYFESGSTSQGAYIGAYVNNSPSEKIYNNTFSKFNNTSAISNGKSSGLIIAGDNTDTGLELQIKCNDFGYNQAGTGLYAPNSYDIALIDATIDNYQGVFNFSDPNNITNPANNRFGFYYNDGSPTAEKAFYINSGSTYIDKYYVYKGGAETDLLNNYTSSKMGYTDNNVFASFVKDDACPETGSAPPVIIVPGPILRSSNYNPINGISELSNVLTGFEQEVSAKKQELQNKLDNGNTDILLSKVQTVSESNYDAVSNEIAQTNGYVSDIVLDEFMKKDMNHPIAKTIALRETSPLPDNAKAEIDNTELNQSLKNYLKIFQNGESPRKQLEKEISIINKQKNYLISWAVKDVVKYDTTGEYTIALINELASRSDLFTQKQVLKLQKHANNSADAVNTINFMRSLTNNLSAEKADNINNWLDVEELEINLALADSTQKDSIVYANSEFLLSLAEDNSAKAQIKAQLMLEKAGIANFIEYTPLPEEEIAPKSMFVNTNNSSNNSSDDLLYIYPNPVNDILTVEYALLSNASINALGIYDLNGKLLKSISVTEQLGIEKINVSSLANGIYIISFGTDGVSSYSKKFTVKH